MEDRVTNEDGAATKEARPDGSRRRGRPLDVGREDAILRATVKLLGERGFDRFTVQDIADCAGVGLGAIYRRWPTKLDVVVAAVRLLHESEPFPDLSGDVEEDLTQALVATSRSLSGCLGSIIPGLVSATRHDAELSHLLRETAVAPRLELLRRILANAFSDRADQELRAELAEAIIVYRFLLRDGLPTEQEIRSRIVPLLLGQPTASPTPRAGRRRVARV